MATRILCRENSKLLGRSCTGEGASKSITGGDSGGGISPPPLSVRAMLHQSLAHELGISPFVWIRGKVSMNSTWQVHCTGVNSCRHQAAEVLLSVSARLVYIS